MPASPITTGSAIAFTAPPHQVLLKTVWADTWVAVPHLYCDRLEFSAAPGISAASLTWRYGVGMPAGTAAFGPYAPLSLNGKLIKIVVTPAVGSPIEWFGRVLETPDNRHGAITVAGSATPIITGVQTFQAAGLEIDLAREPLLRSIVKTGFEEEQEIGRAIDFNRGNGEGRDQSDVVPNATTTPGTKGTKIFAEDMLAALPWTGSEILEYLFTYFAPRGPTGLAAVPWQADFSAALNALTANANAVPVEGRTIKDIADALVSRQRLCGWRVVVDELVGAVYLKVFTFNEADLTLPDGTIVPANPNQKSFNFDQAFDVSQATINTTASNRFDQVILRGARRGSVFNIAKPDGTLGIDWSTDQQTTYNDGASKAADYAALPADEKLARNAIFRTADSLARVYSYFALPASWDGLAGDGAGGSKLPAFPVLAPDTGEASGNQNDPFWWTGLRIERYVPLKTAHDYTDDKINEDAVVDNSPSQARAEFLPPIVLLQTEATADGAAVDRWQHVEHLTAASGETAAEAVPFSVRVQDASPGLVLNAQGGPQHHLAGADYTAPADPGGEEAVLYDWRDLLAVVYILNDSHVEARYPQDSEIAPELDHVRRLTIDVADAHLDWVVPNTVVGIADGALLTSGGGFVRDDRPRLKALARLAGEWYGIERQALTLAYRQILKLVEIGDLITEIGEGATLETIRTCVTRVTYDLLAGTTTIQTEHAELDVSGVSGARGRA